MTVKELMIGRKRFELCPHGEIRERCPLCVDEADETRLELLLEQDDEANGY